MSKQRVTATKVELDIMISKDARFGGGQYHGAKLTYTQLVDGKEAVVEKGFSDYHMSDFPQVKSALAALSQATLPVEIVLERTPKLTKEGKSYDAISSILPKETVINPGEEFVAKAPFKKGGYTPNPKNIALQAAASVSLRGSTAEIVIALAKEFEAYLKEHPGEQSNTDTGQVVSVSTTTPVSTLKF